MLLDERYKARPDATLPERTPDGHPQVWLLYTPEPWEFDSDDNRSIHLWMRRCSVFTSRDAATAHLSSLLGRPVAFQPYAPLFPELWIFRESRHEIMHRWLLCPAPVDALVRTP